MRKPDTKDRILDAAERLFAENGFDSTSIRAITTAAEANLAAVSYHFGSKDGLIHAALARRLGPMNRERLARLEECETEGGEGPLQLERILHAFIAPALTLSGRSSPQRLAFLRLLARLYSETGDTLRVLHERQFRDVNGRFVQAFGKALPGLSDAELWWCLHFVTGTLAHTLMIGSRLQEFTEGLCNTGDMDAIIDRMVDFAAAGMRAAGRQADSSPDPCRGDWSSGPPRCASRGRRGP